MPRATKPVTVLDFDFGRRLSPRTAVSAGARARQDAQHVAFAQQERSLHPGPAAAELPHTRHLPPSSGGGGSIFQDDVPPRVHRHWQEPRAKTGPATVGKACSAFQYKQKTAQQKREQPCALAMGVTTRFPSPWRGGYSIPLGLLSMETRKSPSRGRRGMARLHHCQTRSGSGELPYRSRASECRVITSSVGCRRGKRPAASCRP